MDLYVGFSHVGRILGFGVFLLRRRGCGGLGGDVLWGLVMEWVMEWAVWVREWAVGIRLVGMVGKKRGVLHTTVVLVGDI